VACRANQGAEAWMTGPLVGASGRCSERIASAWR
jgi:hypothetical protein